MNIFEVIQDALPEIRRLESMLSSTWTLDGMVGSYRDRGRALQLLGS